MLLMYEVRIAYYQSEDDTDLLGQSFSYDKYEVKAESSIQAVQKVLERYDDAILIDKIQVERVEQLTRIE